MNKIEVFKKEIEYIKNNDIKESLIFMINILPDYFFEIPASSTGKYHPAFAASDHGLVKHTKVAVRIAYELLNNPSLNKFTNREKDLIIMALILHDGLKSVLTHKRYKQLNHPTLIKNFVIENKDKIELSDNELELFGRVVESHMGPWNKDYDGNEVLPVPKTKCENFVHMCDYLSSKKFLNVNFSGNEIVDRAN